LELSFEALPIAVSGLLDLIDLTNGCFAHANPIDRAALPPHLAIGYSSRAMAGSPVVTRH
jgi:hypothetical protein